MTTVVVGEDAEITAWLRRRRALGHDHRDEVWEGVHHVVPHAPSEHAAVAAELLAVLRPRARALGLRTLGEFNLGRSGDLRVPDGGWVQQSAPQGLYLPTAEAVLEVLSPDDETFAKLDFHARHGVQEVLVAHPREHWVQVHRPSEPGPPLLRSTLFSISATELQELVDWP